MNVLLVLSVFLIKTVAGAPYSAADGPIVEISQGRIQGVSEITPGGKPFFSFLGIPYAEPPLNDLRFKVGGYY